MNDLLFSRSPDGTIVGRTLNGWIAEGKAPEGELMTRFVITVYKNGRKRSHKALTQS